MWLLPLLLAVFVAVLLADNQVYFRQQRHAHALARVDMLTHGLRICTGELEGLALAVSTHPFLALDKDSAQRIALCVSINRQMLAMIAEEPDEIDFSHMHPSHAYARWPFAQDGSVRKL